MKKLLKLVLLAGLFMAFSSSEANAQTITNNTDCTFQVTVYYSSFGCGSQTLLVPPNSLSAVLPGKISAASGSPFQLTFGYCGFRVSDGDCAPGVSLIDQVNCVTTAPCTNFTATLDNTTGNLFIN